MNSKNLRQNQAGFASIIIAIILILVLSLITVGFAQLMRHEQRSALDKQLSSQAYYAAETGVNDATKAISAGYLQKKDTCGPIIGAASTDPAYALRDNKVGGANGTTVASYPCLLINPTPDSLDYSSIPVDQSDVVQIKAVDAAGVAQVVNRITFSWQDAVNSDANFISAANQCNVHSSGGTWGKTGYLRTQIVPIPTPAQGFSRASLATNSYTLFLCPSQGGNSTITAYNPSNSSNQGEYVSGNCQKPANPGPFTCTSSITGLSFQNQSVYLLVLRSIYANTHVNISVYNTAGTRLNIAGAQALIDSTGKAQDVLRRVQVRLPFHNTYPIPDGTEATSVICKQLQVFPGYATSDCD